MVQLSIAQTRESLFCLTKNWVAEILAFTTGLFGEIQLDLKKVLALPPSRSSPIYSKTSGELLSVGNP